MPRNNGTKNNKNGNWNTELSFGTWNVRTQFITRAAHTMTQETEIYEFKVVANQEIRWQETGSLDINNQIIFHVKFDDGQQFNTVFIVYKSLVPTIIKFRSINPRISWLTIKAQRFNINLISVHASTEEKTQEKKDNSNDKLVNGVDTITNTTILDLMQRLKKK